MAFCNPRIVRLMAHDQPGEKKSKRLNATATEIEVSDFVKACKKVELQPPAVLRSLAAAFVRHVRKNKNIQHPIELAEPRG